MPNTYVALDKVTVGTATSSITFSGINQGYTDLVIVVVPATTSGNDNLGLRVGNGSVDTGSNYSVTVLTGNGSTASSDRQSNQTSFLCDYYGSTGATLGNNIKAINIMNYSNTATNKTILLRANRADSGTDAIVGLWRSTVAINTVTLFGRGGSSFAVGSTFSLYGIAAAPTGTAKATGGYIVEDASYYYHLFTGSGTFTALSSFNADILSVAGGGGGGYNRGGGGGAGGLLGLTSQSLTATSYTVTVGAGGAGSSTSAIGSSGGNSQFGGLTSAVGGGGAASGQVLTTAANGGSGGGGVGYSGDRAGGTGTSGQGFAGGTGKDSGPNYGAGGGGGAAAVGANGTTTAGGNGGIGSSTYSSWSAVTGVGQLLSGTYYLAGGGGGASYLGGTPGTGGTGGGGNGGATTPGLNALGSTGGGGGGGGNNNTAQNGGNGGSGVVIVRYAK